MVGPAMLSTVPPGTRIAARGARSAQVHRREGEVTGPDQEDDRAGIVGECSCYHRNQRAVEAGPKAGRATQRPKQLLSEPQSQGEGDGSDRDEHGDQSGPERVITELESTLGHVTELLEPSGAKNGAGEVSVAACRQVEERERGEAKRRRKDDDGQATTSRPLSERRDRGGGGARRQHEARAHIGSEPAPAEEQREDAAAYDEPPDQLAPLGARKEGAEP